MRNKGLQLIAGLGCLCPEIEKLQQQYPIASTRISTLQQATGNAHLLFKIGIANYLEVITAPNNMLQSELELASFKRQQLSAVARLYCSLGGWK